MDLSKFAVSDFEVTLAEATSKKSSKRSSKDGSNLSPIEDISLPSVSGTSAEGDQRENQVDVSFIKSLDVAVTRKICTGQIVISLAGACRELIDNSLDAGASSIDIRVRENGVESLEIIDNGSGIAKADLQYLCKPHSTSKLFTVEDFDRLTTFGFRGEALNALCALSDVMIITRDKNSIVGTKLAFDKNGTVLKQENVPRSVGTSVIVSNLFAPLPVRRQEFQRNSRKEFLKSLACIQSFALSQNCRFTCSNVVNGKLYPMLSSPGGSKSLNEILSSLFGAKAEKGDILEIEQKAPSDEVRAQYGVKTDDPDVFNRIGLSGVISSPGYGNGRSSADRQFVYVNRRLVDAPKINRIANEVYSSFNRGRYCLLVLFITVDSGRIDVNVSPDKKTVFFQQEKELFAKLRASLLNTLSKVSGVCPTSNANQAAELSFENATFIPESQMSDEQLLENSDTESLPSQIFGGVGTPRRLVTCTGEYCFKAKITSKLGHMTSYSTIGCASFVEGAELAEELNPTGCAKFVSENVEVEACMQTNDKRAIGRARANQQIADRTRSKGGKGGKS